MPDFNDFLTRIQTDYAFYAQIKTSPQEALGPYELSAEERLPKVQQTMAQICGAKVPADRSAAVVALMEEIG